VNQDHGRCIGIAPVHIIKTKTLRKIVVGSGTGND